MTTIGAAAASGTDRYRVPPETGWPFFRLAADPVLRRPVRVAWCEPHLEVTCRSGACVRLDLALGMLPSFGTWRRDAPEWERAHARRYHGMLGRRRRALPAGVLAELTLGDVAA